MADRIRSTMVGWLSALGLGLVILTGAGLLFVASVSDARSTEGSALAEASQSPAEPAPADPAAPANSDSATDYGRTGYLSITGPIDRLRKRYLSRVIDEARAEKLDTLVVHIDTDGGTVFDARDMFKQVLDQDRDGPRMVALVDYRAISAGAMIAYAHQELYVSETASIGDIGVIFRNKDGEIEYAPEKIETVVRTLLTQAAELRGWNRGLLLKMTAHKQLLYRATLPDGSVHYVIEDDFPDFLSRHPQLDKEDPKQVIVHRGADRLITLTGREAVQFGMATALVADKAALFERLGIDEADVVDFSPKFAERTAWWLAPFTPILAGLAFLLIMFELKTPGVGLWAALGAGCAALFLTAHFYLDLAENIEIILILLGLGLLLLEFFTGAGGGVIGLMGGGAAIAGLLMAFIPNDLTFDLSDPRFQAALRSAAWNTVLAAAIVAAGLVYFVVRVPRSSLIRRVAMPAEISATSRGEMEESAEQLVGTRGMADENLRPSGSVTLAGRTYSARAQHGDFVPAGTAVEVLRVEFGELLVRPLESDGDQAPLAKEKR